MQVPLGAVASACCLPCVVQDATTVIVLRTNHDIVVGIDGKTGGKGASQQAGGKSLPGAAGLKWITIDNRIVCANAGPESIPNVDASYSFDAMMQEIKGGVPPSVTVSNVVGLLKAKLAAKFRGFDIELQTGRVKPEDLAPPHTTLLKYYVIGYEIGAPYVYTVEMDIDWNATHLTGPIITPQSSRKNLSLTWTGAEDRGIIELRDKTTAACKKAAIDMPQEMQALTEDTDLAAPQMLRLGCGL